MEDTAGRTLRAALLRRWAARNADALKQVLAQAVQSQSGVALISAEQAAKMLAATKLRAWANQNRSSLVAAADVARGAANRAAATPPAAFLELRRLISVGRLRTWTTAHINDLMAPSGLHDQDGFVRSPGSRPQAVNSAPSPTDMVEKDSPGSDTSAATEGGGFAEEANPAVPALDLDQAQQARIKAFKISLRADDRARGRERLKRITNVLYSQWQLRYRTKLDAEFRLLPDSPYAAALGIIAKTDPPYLRRRIQAFAVRAFKERADQKRERDAFWAPLDRHLRPQKADVAGSQAPNRTAPPASTSRPADARQSDRATSGSPPPPHQGAIAKPPVPATPPSIIREPVIQPVAPPTSPPATVSSTPSIQAPAPPTKSRASDAATAGPSLAKFTPNALRGDERVLAATIVALNNNRENPLFRAAVKASPKSMQEFLLDWMRRTMRDDWSQFAASVVRDVGGRDRNDVLKAAARICTSKGVDVIGKGSGGNGKG